MIEALGIVFGGVARLVQHKLELNDKKDERAHEAVMFDKQIKLQEQKIEADKSMRQMEITAQQDVGEMSLLAEAIKAQSQEAIAAGGWVAKLSASVRPVVTYWLLVLYSISKFCALFLSLKAGAGLAETVRQVYSEFDGALLGSIVSFWFADRSLRKVGK